jgi:hypothetical protein
MKSHENGLPWATALSAETGLNSNHSNLSYSFVKWDLKVPELAPLWNEEFLLVIS